MKKGPPLLYVFPLVLILAAAGGFFGYTLMMQQTQPAPAPSPTPVPKPVATVYIPPAFPTLSPSPSPAPTTHYKLASQGDNKLVLYKMEGDATAVIKTIMVNLSHLPQEDRAQLQTGITADSLTKLYEILENFTS